MVDHKAQELEKRIRHGIHNWQRDNFGKMPEVLLISVDYYHKLPEHFWDNWQEHMAAKKMDILNPRPLTLMGIEVVIMQYERELIIVGTKIGKE